MLVTKYTKLTPNTRLMLIQFKHVNLSGLILYVAIISGNLTLQTLCSIPWSRVD